MARIRGSIDIARPVESVFDFVADQRNEPSYNPSMCESLKITDGPIGVGTRFRATILRRGKPLEMVIEYTGFDRPRLLASRTVMPGTLVTGQLSLEPIPAGTRFLWDWEVAVQGAARLAGPAIGLIGRRQERAIWTALKQKLEGSAGP